MGIERRLIITNAIGINATGCLMLANLGMLDYVLCTVRCCSHGGFFCSFSALKKCMKSAGNK